MTSILKRCTATFLAAAMVFTSVNLDGFVASAAQNENSVEVTDVEMIVKNYGTEGSNILTEDELTILNSGVLQENTYSVAKPTDSETLVDSDNNMVYANNIDGDGYQWIAESADILIEGQDAIQVELTADAAKESGFDVAASYVPGGAKDYTVNVNYSLYITVDEANQERLLNVSSYMVEAVQNMLGYMDAATYMDLILPQVVNLGDKMDLLKQDLKNVLLKWEKQYNTNECSALTMALLDEDTGYDVAESKVENLHDYGNDYKELAKETIADINVILSYEGSLKPFFGNSTWRTIKTALTNIQNGLADTIASDWAITQVGTLLKEDLAAEEIAEFEASLEDMDLIETHDADVIKSENLLAATAAVECNVNRYAVTVVMAATAYNEVGTEVSLNRVNSTVLNISAGATVEEVAKAVEENGFEAATLEIWDDYNVGTENYTRTVAAGFEDKLTEDVTYVITYAPKTYTVSYEGDSTGKEPVSYGQVITLKDATEGAWYTYTADGTDYEQGSTYRVLGDVTFKVVSGVAKQKVRVYDLIAEYYDSISDNAKAILTNAATSDDYIYIRIIDDTKVKIPEGEEYVLVPEMEAAEGMKWVPKTVTVYNGSDVLATIEDFTNGRVDISTYTECTDIKVDYELKVNVSQDELKAALALPNTLVGEAKQQLADLATLASAEYKNNLGQITGAILKQLINSTDPDMPQLNEESLDAVQGILDNCIDGNQLKLLTYVQEYENLDNEGRLEYYYKAGKYAEIKNQAELVAGYFEILVEDENLEDVLIYFGQGPMISKIQEAASKLDKLTSKFGPKNDAINVNASASSYKALLNTLAAEAKNTTVSDYAGIENGLYMYETLSVAAPNRSAVKITVKIGDKTYSDSFTYNSEKGIDSDDLETIAVIVGALEAKAGIDKDLYEVNDVTLPEEGATGNITLDYVWTAKQYTVAVEGCEKQSITSDNAKIILPSSGDANITYVYTIGETEVRVKGDDTDGYEYIFSDKDLKTLFTDGTLNIGRTEIDVTKETTTNFIKSLNEALVTAKADDAASFVAFEDVDGNLSVVLKVNPFSENLTTALMKVMTTAATQASYVAIGEEDFINIDIYMNALVQAVLNNNNEDGVGTKTLLNVITTNGGIVENTKEVVNGQTLITDVAAGVDTDSLGGLLVETTMTVEEADEMPLYISIEDYDSSASQLQQLRNYIAKADPYVEVVCQNGVASVKVNVPETAYDYYIAAMLVEGKVDLQNFEEPTLAEMVEYAKSLENGVVLDEDSTVTGTTISNTVSKLGKDASEYVDTMNKVLKAVRSFINNEEYFMETGYVTDDTYGFEVAYPAINIVDALNIELEDGLRNKVAGNIEVPVEVVADVCNTEYTALVITKTDAAKDIYDLKTTEAITTNAASVIVLLDDVDSITTNGTTILDLNGHKVETLTANGTTYVVNSDLASAETPDKLIANESGDVVVSGAEEYYTITEDADGNYTISIAADILEIDEMPAYKAMAVELIAVVVLNEYTSAGLTVDGNTIYDIEVEDVIGSYNNGLKNLLSDLVECFSEEGTENFINAFIEDVTDFEEIQNALKADGVVAKYTLTTAPWDVALEKASSNYLTASVTSGEATEKTLTVKFVGNTQELADLAGELATIVTEKEVVVDLGEIAYDAANGFSADGLGADIALTIDLTQSDRDYLTAIAVVLANGMDDPSAMVKEINNYLETGVTVNLVAKIEKLTLSQIITSLKAANEVSFTEMVDKLGVNVDSEADVIALADVYYDVLNLGGKLVSLLDITGGSQTLAGCKADFATYGGSKENWHRMNIDLTLILAKEVKEPVVPDAVINVPTVDTTTLYGAEVDAENKIIYIDAGCDGITGTEFKNLVDFHFENVQDEVNDVKWVFAADEEGLVRTGDTVEVTAWNSDQKEPVEVSETYKIIVVGDTNKDGKVTSSDAALTNSAVVGNESLDDNQLLAANVNKSTDQVLTSTDAALINKKVAYDYDPSAYEGEAYVSKFEDEE